jgi:diphthine-ammonia ligase
VHKVKVAALWSGGKDSCLAAYEAVSKGSELSTLLSFDYKGSSNGSSGAHPNVLSTIYDRVGRASPSIVSNVLSVIYKKDLSRMVPHEIAPEIITMQAQAMELPLLQKEVTWDTFECQLRLTIRQLKLKGVEGLVFGLVPPHYPIDTSEKLREHSTLVSHKEWMSRICNDLGIEPITPLWEKNPDQILNELVQKDFEVIIVVVDSKLLGEKWLGRKIDSEFIDTVHKLNRQKGTHIGGSGYHTIVTDGPLFKKKLKIVKSRKVNKKGYLVLDIVEMQAVKKT